MSERERRFKRSRLRFHPQMFQELAIMSGDGNDGLIGLLLIAGFVRDEFPWLAELITETYREIRNGSREEIEVGFLRLRNTIKQMRHHPLFREFFAGSKDSLVLFEELPVMLDVTFQHLLDRAIQRRAGKLE